MGRQFTIIKIFNCGSFNFNVYKYMNSLGEDPGLMNDPAFDDQSSSLIKLNNGTILYLREVCSFLALVCILREDNFEKQSE